MSNTNVLYGTFDTTQEVTINALNVNQPMNHIVYNI